MNCHEARKRLTGSHRDGAPSDSDPALLEHIRHCPACARHARAAHLLQQSFAQAGAADDGPVPQPAEMRRRVEAVIACRQIWSRWWETMRIATRLRVPRWRRFGFGLVAAAVALAVISLVPFSYHHTVAYDVAVEGVDREVALNTERLCDTLFGLGLFEAGVDVTGCDTTCGVTIIDLKSEEEICMAVTALCDLTHKHLTPAIIPVKRPARASLLHQVNEKLFASRLTTVQCDAYH